MACSPQAAVRKLQSASTHKCPLQLTFISGVSGIVVKADMEDPGRSSAASASASNSRSATHSHMSLPEFSARSNQPVQRLRPRKGVPQRCLQGDCFLDCAPFQKATAVEVTKQEVPIVQHNAVAYDDPPYAPSHKRKASGSYPGYPQVQTATRSQRRRDETPGFSHDGSHDGSQDLDITNGGGEVGVRRSKRQRRTVAGFEGYDESLSLELSADDVVLLEEEEEEEAPVRISHVFQSREEALAALARDVMRTAGVQSFRICLELANDLARYKHPSLPDWPKYTPHVC
jgi:hypothetical protein